MFVDAPFIKSWLVKGAGALDSLWYANVDLESRSKLPPWYLGVASDDLGLEEGLACEVWVSACHGVILHVHSNLEEKYSAYSGGNPIGQKKNPGTAYFFNKATDIRWVALGLRSFRRHFPRQRRILANLQFEVESNYALFGERPSGAEAQFVERILAKYDETLSPIPVSVSFQMGVDERFFAKVALGLGSKLGGAVYLNSNYCKRLRAHLNEPDPSKRLPIGAPPLGTGKGGDALHEMLTWKGGILLFFVKVDNVAGFHLSIWGRHASIALSDEAEATLPEWDRFFPSGGAIFVIVPQTEYFSTAINPVDFVGHVRGQRVHPALALAEQGRLASLDELPPRIPERASPELILF